MKANEEIAGRLRQFGLERFGSLKAFAQALGISPEHLSQYVNGKSRPGNKMQSRLRDLGCDIEWLMTGYKVYDIKRNPGAGKVNEPADEWIIPREIKGKERQQLIQLINELSKLKPGDRKKAREVIKTIFPK